MCKESKHTSQLAVCWFWHEDWLTCRLYPWRCHGLPYLCFCGCCPCCGDACPCRHVSEPDGVMDTVRVIWHHGCMLSPCMSEVPHDDQFTAPIIMSILSLMQQKPGKADMLSLTRAQFDLDECMLCLCLRSLGHLAGHTSLPGCDHDIPKEGSCSHKQGFAHNTQ